MPKIGNSRSNSRCHGWLPEILRVPPAAGACALHRLAHRFDTAGAGPSQIIVGNTQDRLHSRCSPFTWLAALGNLPALRSSSAEITVVAVLFESGVWSWKRHQSYLTSCLGIRRQARATSSARVLHRNGITISSVQELPAPQGRQWLSREKPTTFGGRLCRNQPLGETAGRNAGGGSRQSRKAVITLPE